MMNNLINFFLCIEWPVGLVNWISFFSNISTICAFFIAVWVWLTWRRQQGFSDERKALLDAEHLISEIYVNTFHRFSRGVLIVKNRISLQELGESNPFSPQFIEDSKKQLELSHKDDQRFYELNAEYQAVKLRLELMDIKFINEYDPNIHEEYVRQIKNQVLDCNNYEDLNKFAQKVTFEIDDKKKKILKIMKKYRKKHYS